MQGKVPWQMIVLALVVIVLMSIGCGVEQDMTSPEISIEIPEDLVETRMATFVVSVSKPAEVTYMVYAQEGPAVAKGLVMNNSAQYVEGAVALVNLQPDGVYEVQVTAKDLESGSARTRIVYFRTKAEAGCESAH